MQLFQIYHHRLSKLIHDDFRLFEISIWLHVFSRALIIVFIPILLINIGYEIRDIIIYLAIVHGFDIPLNFLARFLTRKLGARIVIIFGSFASIIYFVCFFGLKANSWLLLILMAFSLALYDALYWVAHLYFFMKCSPNDDNVGGDTSSLDIVRRVASILAPAIGALVLIFANQKVLIAMSIFFLALSIVPLFLIRNVDDKPSIPQLKFREFFNSWYISKDYLSRSFFSVHDGAENIIWPIFIFTLFGSIESVAWLPIIVSVTTIIFTYFTGRLDKQNRNTIIAIGSFMIALIWLARLIFANNIFYYISVFLVGLFTVLVSIPIDSNIFEKNEPRDALSASMYRNFFGMFARFLFYIVLFVLVDIFDISFISAAISVFMVLAVYQFRFFKISF